MFLGNTLRSTRVYDENNISTVNSSRDAVSECKEICLCMAIVGSIISALFFVILFFICQVLEDQPTLTTSVSLAYLDFSVNNNNNNGSSSLHSLNVTFNVDMVLVNNHVNGGVNYKRSTMFLRYKRDNIDMAQIPSFHVGYKRTRNLNLTLTFVSHRVLNISNDESGLGFSDPVSKNGVLGLRTYVRFSGKGRILVYRVYPVWWANHDLFINLASRSLSYTECDLPNQGKMDYGPVCKT